MQTLNAQNSWVNVLSKGLITIPKKMREKVGIKEGDVALVTVKGKKIIIEPHKKINYRIFTKEEIDEWMKEDELTPAEAKKIEKKMAELWPELP